eukprot:TRINITY_DN103719_c0_g1_i1.p1 TRINITY_DN103719_c0_g1~~TRINITY_DN103719_c0_g1_i1.p1  ORF type:complete len:163 (-),score=33.13 TRINITY_DN103719_c0_g1_i1:177-665(-)
MTYRPNAGAVIFNKHGKVLCGKRKDHGAWQFPQGGTDPGESSVAAAKREVEEEIGLTEKDGLVFVTEIGKTLSYTFPDGVGAYWKNQGFIGQAQQFSLFFWSCENPSTICKLGGTETEPAEFSEVDWKDWDDVVSAMVPFKKGVYEELQQLAAPIIAEYNKA